MFNNALRRLVNSVVYVIVISLIIAFLFLLVEGISNTYTTFKEIAGQREPAERLHGEYDAEIGWVNMPDIHLGDLYGKGKYLNTNSQLFRNKEDFEREVPAGKIRILCSGDSFTLGYGVDDFHTWCHQLTELDGRLQTVNMGQGGYGVDQAFLLYRRNCDMLESDIHVFGFIAEDFRRMKTGMFIGYGKPVLDLINDSLMVLNVPVPNPSLFMRVANQLQTIRLLRSLLNRNDELYIQYSDDHTRLLVSYIFDELKETSYKKNIKLVLLYLPTKRDGLGLATGRWLDFIKEYAMEKDVILIDLVDEFQDLSKVELNRMFNGAHYSEKGNRFAAEAFYRKLLATKVLPEPLSEESRD